jgi:NADPH:quinone reductase-like Zn-dependent oxidoreductase
MRAFAVDAPGQTGSVRNIATPELGERDVLVRVRVAGVNPVDWKKLERTERQHYPVVLGQDFAGVVERIGTAVTSVRAGDRVFGIAQRHGAYAEFTVVGENEPAEPFAVIPGGMSDETAAALPTAGLTALAAVDTLAVAQGVSLLVIGATGGVGGYAVQIAKWRSANVIGVAEADQEAAAHRFGADVFIAAGRGDVVEAVRARYPEGVDAVLDLVSDAEQIKHIAGAVRRDGMLVSTIRSVDEQWFAQRGIAAQNVNLYEMPQDSAAGLGELATLVTSGAVTVHIDGESPLDAAADVLERSKNHAIAGKALLRI